MNFRYPVRYFIRSLKYEYSHIRHHTQFKELREYEGEYSLKGFDQLKCIYIHIPKTAGISINMALFGNYGGGHKDVCHYKRVFGPVTYKKYFTFTFVRNPYSRLYSAYRFLKKGGFGEADKVWADKNLSEFNSFEQFVTEGIDGKNIPEYTHFIPQYKFVCDIDLIPDVDFIGKFESLQADFNHICSVLKVQSDLPSLNKSHSDNWRAHYNDKLRRKVYNAYQQDFKVFNYESELDL